jgi:Holliday junction DNA helicase RuvA
MIAALKGRLAHKHPTHIVLDVHGVGYSVFIPVSSYQRLGDVGSEVAVLTYLHVRENTLQLYGFITDDERDLFEHLLTVSGVGPRTALGILSGMRVEDFRAVVGNEDWEALTALPGIGKKTAQRLVVELKEKVGLLEAAQKRPSAVLDLSNAREATSALVELGVPAPLARKTVEEIVSRQGRDLPAADILRQALRHKT